jgi:hypothetical protein
VQQDNDRSACFQCREGTYSLVPGGEGIGKNYDAETFEADCQVCHKGAKCAHGLPLALNGWWRPPPRNGSEFFKCKAEEACLGVPNIKAYAEVLRTATHNESCGDGYEGRLCHRCSPGFSRSGTDKCRTCYAVGVGATAIAALGIVAVILAFAAFIWQAMNMSANDKTSAGLTLKIAAAHMQVMAIASNLPFRWPPATEAMFRIMDAASSVSEDVIALECMFAESRFEAQRDASEPQESVVFTTTSLILVGPILLLVPTCVPI